MSKTVKGVVKTTAVILALSTILGSPNVLAATLNTPSSTSGLSQCSSVASVDINYSSQAIEGLNYINSIRAKAGLSAVKLNPFLTKASENHAKYLNSNNERGHDEIKGKKNFTGEAPSDRVLAVGGSSTESKRVAEVASKGYATVKDSIDGLIDAPYHRTSILDTGTEEIGIGMDGTSFVLKSIAGNGDAVSVYPYDGQTGVGLSFDGSIERPNPLEQFGVATSGYVISLSTRYVLSTDKKDIKASITDSAGQQVPYFSNGIYGFWFFYPKTKLKGGEKYTVSVNYSPITGSDKGKIFNQAWSFTTAGASTTPTPVPPTTGDPVVKPSGSIPATSTTKYSKDNVGVKINGQAMVLSPKAQVINNSTFIPLRGVFEKLNASLTWNQAKKEVSIVRGDIKIILTVGSQVAYVNGNAKTLSAAPFVDKTGSTFVPLRFASETIGASVGWDAKNWIATITAQ